MSSFYSIQKIFLSSLSLSAFFFLSFMSGTPRSYGSEQCLKGLMQLEVASCHDVKDLALPFLKKEKREHDKKAQELLSQSFLGAVQREILYLGQVDFVMSYSGQEVDSKASMNCSLDKIKSDLSCKASSLGQYISLLSKGKYSDLDGLLDGIGQSFYKMTSFEIDRQAKSCLSPSYKKEVYLDEVFSSFSSVDLKELLGKRGEFSGKFSEVETFLDKIYPKFRSLGELVDIHKIQGKNLKEQFFSLMGLAQKPLSQKLAKRCGDFLQRMDRVLCHPVEDLTSQNEKLNKKNFEYSPSLFKDGFNEEDLLFSGVESVENAYKKYIVNCPLQRTHRRLGDSFEEEGPKEREVYNIDTFFSFLGGSFDDSYREIRDENSFQNKLKSYDAYCPYFNCANAHDVAKGKSCRAYKTPAALSQIRKNLNCKRDEFCRERAFESIFKVMAKEEAREFRTLLRGKEGAKVPAKRKAGMSSFSSRFVTSRLRKKVINSSRAQEETSLRTPSQKGNSHSSSVETSLSQNPFPQPSLAEDGTLLVGKEEGQGGQRGQNLPSSSLLNPRSLSSSSISPVAAPSPVAAAKISSLGKDSSERRKEDLRIQRKTLEEMIDQMMKKGKPLSHSPKRGQENSQTRFSDIAQANNGIEKRYEAGRGEDYSRGRSWGDGLERGIRNLRERENRDYIDYGRREARVFQKGLEEGVQKGVQEGVQEGRTRLPPHSSDLSKNETRRTAEKVSPKGEKERTKASRGPASQGGEKRAKTVAGINDLLDKMSELSSQAKWETSARDLPGLSEKDLIQKGVATDDPFVMIIKDEKGRLSLPVRPVLFRGLKILTPVLDESNIRLSNYLRRSPLFERYYQYQDSI